MKFEPEFERQLTKFIENALLEDAPQGDQTSLACIPPDAQCTGMRMAMVRRPRAAR